MIDLQAALRDTFGLEAFRPRQREVIEAVLAGRDVLCVMPTGAGKSLCYQLPAAVGGGLTIVVSPLISLMEDQVQQLRDEGLAAAVLNSSLSYSLQQQVMEELERGFDGLLYVAPERFKNSGFQSLMRKLKPKLLAIDEAHCISQWGHDFRPDYANIGQVRRDLGHPPTIALTATATADVRGDIIHNLGLSDPTIVVTGFDRPNLLYESQTIRGGGKEDRLLEIVRKETGSGIVYCATRKNVVAVTEFLIQSLPDRPVYGYHGGMGMDERTENQEQFMGTPHAIAVATNAFGMGINKPDLRWVIHYNIPGTLEAYYQEAGRAGRDGRAARCIILFSYQDKYTQDYFIKNIGRDNPDADLRLIEQQKERARHKLDQMIRYADGKACRRRQILDYFGDTAAVAGCQCDNCRGGRGEIDESALDAAAPAVPQKTVLLIRKMLSAVARLNGKFGLGIVAEVLTGQDNEKLHRWNLTGLSVYALLRDYEVKPVIAMLHRLIDAGLVRQRDIDREEADPIKIVELTAAGVAVMKGEAPPPLSLADIAPRRRRRRDSGGPMPRSSPRAHAAAGADDLDPAAAARFDRLRQARTELARQRQLPPYCICHDRTLQEIARLAPGEVEELHAVKGMGPHKVEQYGETFLAAMRERA
jgi:ATP-dependent DNA helicase RecQ